MPASRACRQPSDRLGVEADVEAVRIPPKVDRRPYWDLFGQVERLSKAQRATAKPGSKQDQRNVEAMFAHLSTQVIVIWIYEEDWGNSFNHMSSRRLSSLDKTAETTPPPGLLGFTKPASQVGTWYGAPRLVGLATAYAPVCRRSAYVTHMVTHRRNLSGAIGTQVGILS